MKNFKQVFLESQQTGIGSLTSLNESKIELCLFHRNSKPQISVEVNGVQITSKYSINVTVRMVRTGPLARKVLSPA